MRGLNRVLGFLLAVISLAIPYSLRAQGATADQYYAAGNKLYAAKNYTQAIQYFNAAIKLNPNAAAAYQLTGNCYYALGNKKYALAYYQRASAMQPNNAQLAQFVQNLSAQVNAGTAAAPAAGVAAANPLTQGSALFQQKQYAASIPYFQQAIQQNPNDYRGYYYAGYAYYMSRDPKNAALYFAVANAKQPNASIQAYADRIKASLSPDDQQWVDDQVSKYIQGAGAVAAKGGKKKDMAFGFHILGGEEIILANQTQTEKYVTAYNAINSNGIAVTGVAPTVMMAAGVEPFLQFGQNFELDLAFNYYPVGTLSYHTHDYSFANPNGSGSKPDVWNYTFNTTIITANLGGKVFFGGDKVRGYLGLSGGISPISMSFKKDSYDSAFANVLRTDQASLGTYSTMAFSGQARLGVDFYLGRDIAVGPYVGYQYLTATNFQNAGTTLQVDTQTGAIGVPDSAASKSNFPVADTAEPFKFDFSGVTGGANLTFSF